MQPDQVVGVPLYLQIATRVRHEVASGRLREGDKLPSLRAGAARWQVNLHTVRRAYALLEDDGLVKTDSRRGTRIAAAAAQTPGDQSADIDSFVEWIGRTAAGRFGITGPELAHKLNLAAVNVDEPVWVLECSPSLAGSLAKQIAHRTGRDVRPWLVQHVGDVPDGFYLATYYHYADVRGALASRAHPPAFFGVEIESENLKRIAEHARASGQLVVLGVEGLTGGAIATELEAELGEGTSIDVRITRQPHVALREVSPSVPVLMSPENWDRLGAAERDDPRVFELQLQPNEEDLFRIASGFGWR